MECEIIDSVGLLNEEPITSRRSEVGRTPKTPNKADRFISSRANMDMEISHFNLMKENEYLKTPTKCSPSKEAYKEKVADQLFNGKLNKTSKVLALKNKAPLPSEAHIKSRVLYSTHSETTVKKTSRFISQQPIKMLDAPQLVDDYYLNLVDWSRKNILAIALGNGVHFFDASAGTATSFHESENMITSVGWTKAGNHLSIAYETGIVELWDAETKTMLRSLKGQETRVGALAWNNHILSTGSKAGLIQNHDVRARQSLYSTLQGHSLEVCGLKWSQDGLQLASGGNDNVVNIWDINQTQAKFTFTDHVAAVKGLAWCPWEKNLLATGGGVADKTIKFWNTNTGALINSIDTGSQVSQLVWSKTPGCREIVSAHGYSKNQLCVWKYPSLAKVAELTGHEGRILCMAQSPEGETVVSASADETLRFWNIFPGQADVKAAKPKIAAKVASPKIKMANLR